MKILITAGGTTEKIDQVRAITNHSTGRLGQALADYLAANPDTTIDYVTTKQALKPKRHSNITIYTIESALDLFLQLEELTKKEHYDAISTVWQSVILLLLLVFQKNSWQKTYPLLQRKKNWTIGLRKMNRQIPLFQRSLLTPSILCSF